MNELIFQAPLQDTAQAKTNYAVQSGILEYNDSSLDDIAAIVLVVFLFNGFNVRRRKNKVQANPTNLLLLLILILLRYSNYNRTLYKINLPYPNMCYYDAVPVTTEKKKDDMPYLGGYEPGYSHLRSNSYSGGYSHSPSKPYSREFDNGYNLNSSSETIDNSSESYCVERNIFEDSVVNVVENAEVFEDIDNSESIFSEDIILNMNTSEVSEDNNTSVEASLSPLENNTTNESVEEEIINEPSNQLSLMIKDDYFGSKVTVLLPNSSVITGEVVFRFKDILSVKSEDKTIFISEKDIISFF